MMAYSSWSVVFGEQPSAAKWNILGTNDADFNTKLTRVGMVVQVVSVEVSTVATGTTLIPSDDTIPQITEGDQYMSLAITPTSATNKLIIHAIVHGSHSVSSTNAVALFQDATANSLATTSVFETTGTGRDTVPLTHPMVSGTTSSTTFRIRVGGSSAGTFTFNGTGAARIYGGVSSSSLTITEIVV